MYGLSCEIECYYPDMHDNPNNLFEYSLSFASEDGEAEMMEYVLMINTELANPENMRLYIMQGCSINYRWNQSFEIPFTIEENN